MTKAPLRVRKLGRVGSCHLLSHLLLGSPKALFLSVSLPVELGQRMSFGDKREMHAANPLPSLSKRKACFVFIISSYNNNVDGSSTYGITEPK